MSASRIFISALASIALVAPTVAHASGAIVHTDGPIVASHRIAIAVGGGKTTLFDQIIQSQALRPGTVGVIYPVTGDAEVGLSSDVVFAALDAITPAEAIAPPRNCPPAPPGCTARPAPAPVAAVRVKRLNTSGPSEVVRISSADPNAIMAWLRAGGFGGMSPAQVRAIERYVARGFDFIATRSFTSPSAPFLRPLRITTTGTVTVLPLGFLAINVPSLAVWVLASKRYEPKNVPTFVLENLAWTWDLDRSDLESLRSKTYPNLVAGQWEVETSLPLHAETIAATVRSGVVSPPGSESAPQVAAQVDYASEAGKDGSTERTAEQVREDDLRLLLAGADPSGQIRVTRMRSVAQTLGAGDVVIDVASDQKPIGARVVTSEIGEPRCPIYGEVRVAAEEPGATCVSGQCLVCTQVGMAPRSKAGGRPLPPIASPGRYSGGGGYSGGSCARSQVGVGPFPGADVLFAWIGAFALMVVRFRRRGDRSE